MDEGEKGWEELDGYMGKEAEERKEQWGGAPQTKIYHYTTGLPAVWMEKSSSLHEAERARTWNVAVIWSSKTPDTTTNTL